MDTAAVRCSAALLVLGYVSAVCAPLRPSLYQVTIVAFLAALALLAMEWALDRIAQRDRARRAPALTVWMPRHAGV